MSQSESEFELESMLNSSSISNTTPTFTDDELGDLSIIACGSTEVPNVANFILNLNTGLTVILIFECVLFITTLVLFFVNLRLILRNTPKRMVTKTVVVCAIYPVVATASTISSFIPRANFLCDTISHIAFMVCAYVFFCLCLQYVNGESDFVKANDMEVYTMQTPPCCCCCIWMNKSLITKPKFTRTRCLVLQLLVVQTIIFVILNILFIENFEFFNNTILFFIPFIVCSIILGVWGLNITVRMIAPLIPDLKLMKKYFCLQIVLLLCKIQPFIVQAIVGSIISRCDYPLTLFVQKNVITQFLIVAEMTLLSICVKALYRVPVRK